jgi:DNA transposition AAA+ family ATPase
MASQPQDRATETVDIDAVRTRLNAYKMERGLSWQDLAARVGLSQGTLSAFGVSKYSGDNARVAAQVDRWFTAEIEQEALRRAQPIEAPRFIPTRAAKQITANLHWAKRGNMVVVAAAPGFGKTSTLRQFEEDVPQSWLATMAPSTAGVATMLAEILDAMGERDARGSPQMLTKRIKDRLRSTNGLIMIDEAQHLTQAALEELRGLHDVTKIGIALVGNAGLLSRLEGGNRHVAFAQLYSRVSMRVVRNLAYVEDGVALGRAWGIDDERMLAWLGELTVKPGGLRSVSMVIELASVLCAAEDTPLSFTHLRDAWAQLSTRPVAA